MPIPDYINRDEKRPSRTHSHVWLSQYQFESIREVQDYATHWLWFYNNERPNKANGGFAPTEKRRLNTAHANNGHSRDGSVCRKSSINCRSRQAICIHTFGQIPVIRTIYANA